ncbi:CNNM domain-containing protein, partial [Parabacteroides sp. OttesenSCG-928-G07]|nr:CNNM domain-containing protein [Parabacteroides sp. OttesenSCG-928-G07]
MTVGAAIALGVATLFLCLSALVSGSEIAFFSLSPNDLHILKEGKKRMDNIIRQQLEQSEYLLASIQITNIFANISVVILFSYAINITIDFSSTPIFGFILEIIALTFLLLLFGEIMPKIYAQKNPLKFVRFSAPFIKSIEKISHPLARLLVSSSFVVNNTIGKKRYDLSVDELSKALELTSSEIPEEKEMLEEIIKFYDKTADEIMTSRLDVEDIDIKMNFREVIDFVVQSGYSRIPVYSESEDNIKGILYIKDLLPYIDKPETFRWQSLIRPAYFVPETKKIDDLLEEFRTNKIHMAIVVDEFGGTSGI